MLYIVQYRFKIYKIKVIERKNRRKEQCWEMKLLVFYG